jgi:hypothetical protein
MVNLHQCAMAHQTGNLPKKEEVQQQLPIIAIQHYRLLQQQRRATTTTTTTPTTHLQKTDMITTMSRGNHEDRVGSVQGRQVDQEEEGEEVEEEEEEEMKTEKLEGTESTENVSKMSSGEIWGEISGEISGSPRKRTTASVNSAQAGSIGVAKGVANGEISEKVSATRKRTHASLKSAQASGNKASTQKKTPNIAQAGSIGVASGVTNDSNQP